MTNRNTTRTVTFRHPFVVAGIDGLQPAGSYIVEMEDELLQSLSFPAWRRIRTAIRIPRHPGSSVTEQVAPIDPAEIDAALTVDTVTGD